LGIAIEGPNHLAQAGAHEKHLTGRALSIFQATPRYLVKNAANAEAAQAQDRRARSRIDQLGQHSINASFWLVIVNHPGFCGT
jgi:hypothetical protein